MYTLKTLERLGSSYFLRYLPGACSPYCIEIQIKKDLFVVGIGKTAKKAIKDALLMKKFFGFQTKSIFMK